MAIIVRCHTREEDEGQNVFLMTLDTEEEKRLFEKLYRKYVKMMYNIAFSVLQNEFEAEDAVSSAFEKLMRQKDKVPDVESDRTRVYLAVTVRNTSIDLYRKKKRMVEVPWESAEEMEKIPYVYQRDHEEDLGLLEDIRNLPEKYRQTLSLKYTAGYTDREIAEILNISESNVRKRIERAKKMLQKGGKYHASN